MRKLGHWKELITTDFPDGDRITKATVAGVKSEARRFRASMRVATGRLYTDEEFEKRRSRVLGTPLP